MMNMRVAALVIRIIQIFLNTINWDRFDRGFRRVDRVLQ